MIKFVILSLLWLCVFHKSIAKTDCPIHYTCNNSDISVDDKVEVFCNKSQDGIMTGRCCTSNNTIVGLDLRFCEIKQLNISLENFSNLEILDIRHNDFEKFTGEYLNGLLKLNFLYLSSHFPCPGGKDAWNVTSMDKATTSCSYQRDPCQYLDISCGEEQNAKCHHLGPSLAKCICSEGYHGYKCLNEGEFPIAIFGTSVVIPAFILGVVLWFVQGRDVYRKFEIEE